MTTAQDFINRLGEKKVRFQQQPIVEHHGVKGQKWGIRNDPKNQQSQESGSSNGKMSRKEHKVWLKTAKSPETATSVWNDAAKSFNPKLKKINNDPRFKGKDLNKDRKLRKEYDALAMHVFNQHLAAASIEQTMTKSGRAVIYQLDRGSNLVRATEVQAVLHAIDKTVVPDFSVMFDSNGFIVDLTPIFESSVSQSISTDIGEFLDHHGVKGQKWGIRNKRTSKAGASADKPKAKSLSDEELRKAVNRMQMEKQYNQLIGTQGSRGRKAVKVGAGFVAGIALNVARTQVQNHASKVVETAIAKRKG